MGFVAMLPASLLERHFRKGAPPAYYLVHPPPEKQSTSLCAKGRCGHGSQADRCLAGICPRDGRVGTYQ